MNDLSSKLRIAAHNTEDPALSELIFQGAIEIETLTARLEESRKTRNDLINVVTHRYESKEELAHRVNSILTRKAKPSLHE